MCGIYCSFDIETFEKLKKLNSTRGGVNESQTQFQNYIIGHSQAPTSKISNKHPAVYKTSMLWHNGLILGMQDRWDTMFMCKQLNDFGFNVLSNISGSFACIYLKDDELFVFRNEISPLFVDDKLNISSTKFENSNSIEPNTVFKINLKERYITPVSKFKTKDNPYYFND